MKHQIIQTLQLEKGREQAEKKPARVVRLISEEEGVLVQT
jgi:hypothetical protein